MASEPLKKDFMVAVGIFRVMNVMEVEAALSTTPKSPPWIINVTVRRVRVRSKCC